MSMRIVFAGTPAPAGIILQALIDAGINVDCVITRPDAIVGRKRIPTPSVCAKVAEDCGIQQIKTTRLNPLAAEQEWAKKLLCERFDLGVIVAFGCLLKDPFLRWPRLGWINVHFSQLPKYRGAAPVQRAILNGERETGISIFSLDEGMDTGPLLYSEDVQIKESDTSGTLLAHLAERSVPALLRIIREESRAKAENPIANKDGNAQFTRELLAQKGVATLAPKLTQQECAICWRNSARDIHNLVRAANPEPGAFCFFGASRIKIHESKVPSREEVAEIARQIGQLKKGAVVQIKGSALILEAGVVLLLGGRVFALCGEEELEALELTMVQVEGRKSMSAAAWMCGIKPKTRVKLSTNA